ncbi:MAG: type I-C CRISPR-associated protein Cas8c/Csd1 [Actinobacteria bacterium]|nr:type I-C CRISPR-associated protein Cas8c/Csd1 [Actinomycetota bacterium]
MILQALISFYDRLALADKISPYGFSDEDVGFVVNIDHEGRITGPPEELRTKIKMNIFEYRHSEVPYTNQVNVRANAAAKTPNFMVDKADYVFGMSGKAEKKEHHESFTRRIDEVCKNSTDDGVLAVKAFLSTWNPVDSLALPDWKEISGPHGKWVAFRLQGDFCFVHERSEVKKLWSDFIARDEFPKGVNLLDGAACNLQLQYAQFKFGSGASLVSFNEVAYESYGWKKGENARISVEGEFKSSAALKHLLRSKVQRLRVGDAATVFWAEKETPLEGFFSQIFDPFAADKAATIKVRKFLGTVREGKLPKEIKADAAMKFFILGLSLNRARLALRFWHVGSVAELIVRLHDHFSNLEMERSFDNDIPFPGIWHLLKETARETKNISPILGGTLVRAILTGGHYPQNLYQGVLGRIRADQAKKDKLSGKSIPNVNYLRAAILKAVLQRNYHKEVPMTLDTEKRETAYLLGRLFAVLEKAQLDALGKVNATIKDRFFSAASATPASVFPRLLSLSQHHITKAEYGYISDRRIAEIMEHIDAFPVHLNLQNQGLFAIAYYQQKNALYRKNETKTLGGEK